MPTFDSHLYLADTPFSHAAATRDALLQTMRRYDVSAVALCSGLAARCDFITGNARLREMLNPEEGLFGYLALNADYPEESLEEQRRYLFQNEFVGAALFGHDGNPVTLEGAREVLNAHRRYAKPMAIHVPDVAAVHAARRIAAEFPAMKFIFLTMGGEDWSAAVTVAKQHLNVYLEISGSLDADKVARAAAVLTSRKLLYGSNLPYADPKLTLGLVESAGGLTAYDRRRILYDNAEQLFRIRPAAPGEDEGDDYEGPRIAG